MKFSCEFCGNTFKSKPSKKRKFCSHKCYCEKTKQDTEERRNSPNNFYVYCYLGEDKTPYYVGKGRNGRWKQKSSEREKPSNPENIIKLKENLTEQESFYWEKFFICLYGRESEGGSLVNKSLGGKGSPGVNRTGERREKTSQFYLEQRKSLPPYKLLSPEGVLYEGTDITLFCEEHNLPYRSLRRVIRGIRKSYKGWKLG